MMPAPTNRTAASSDKQPTRVSANHIFDAALDRWVPDTGRLQPSENHIGQVGGNTEQVGLTLTTQAAAYANGDAFGGKFLLQNAMRVNGGTGILQSLFLVDAGNNKPTGTLLIFNADPAESTLTDKTAAVIHANDVSKIIRSIPIYSSDWQTVASRAFQDLSPGGRVLKATSGSRDLYAAFVLNATITPGATNTLTVRLGVLRD